MSITYKADEANVSLAKKAMGLQDACNMLAVSNTLSETLKSARENGHAGREDCRHPAVRAITAKLMDMCGIYTYGYSVNPNDDVYGQCQMLANGEDVVIDI